MRFGTKVFTNIIRSIENPRRLWRTKLVTAKRDKLLINFYLIFIFNLKYNYLNSYKTEEILNIFS